MTYAIAVFRALWSDRRGAYSMMTALLLPVIAGFTAFGTETGLWFYNHQSMQGAADGAAYSAGLAYKLGNTTTYAAEAKAVAAKYGFTDGANGTTVTVNQPPTSGANTSTLGAVEVIIQQPQKRLFSAVLISSAVTIKARAVAAATGGGATACVLGLDPTAAQTVTLSNNAVLPDKNCGVASNSSSASGLYLSNNAVIDGPTSSHGGDVVLNNAVLAGSQNLTNAPVIPDPYASSNPGTPPTTCTTQNGSGSGSHGGPRTFVPDATVNGVGVTRFCSGLNFQNNFAAVFSPGVYFIDSQLVFGNNAVITGNNVTLVINGNYAINIGNNASVNLTAPTTGPTSGIAIFGGRTATSTVTQTFSNNTILNLTGAIYFPNQILQFDNNGTTNPNAGCTQLIARQIQLMNNVDLHANCAGAGTNPMTFGGSLALVE